MLSVGSEILKIRFDPSFRWGSDDVPETAQEAKEEARELTINNNEVDNIVGQLAEDEQELVKLRYFQRGSKDVDIMKQLSLSQSSYYRLRNQIILSAAKMFGYHKY